MNFELLTPHQFLDYSDFLDTVLVFGNSGAPLDIASPQAAARLISQQLATVVLDKYRGRTTVLDVAAGISQGFTVDYWAQFASELTNYKVTFGILLVDRLYLEDKQTIQVEDPRSTWIVFDWFQWLRKHVPPQRLVDSYLFLSMASDLYRASSERKSLGISDVDARAMAKEGRRIIEVMARDLIAAVAELWEVENAREEAPLE